MAELREAHLRYLLAVYELGLGLTKEEAEEYIRMMAINLPEHCWNHSTGRT